jgi:hypothetical protein
MNGRIVSDGIVYAPPPLAARATVLLGHSARIQPHAPPAIRRKVIVK